jgi:hypothetical protein
VRRFDIGCVEADRIQTCHYCLGYATLDAEPSTRDTTAIIKTLWLTFGHCVNLVTRTLSLFSDFMRVC